MNNADELHMRQCFNLALAAEGRTAPNPIVGAVVVSLDGDVVGQGYHPKCGEPHAEVFALEEAGERARGATIYVSLEPCCHHGRTPPCTDKIIESGIKRVVAALRDPNPKVAGEGFAKLREAGIEVTTQVLEQEAEWLNRAFVKGMRESRPWVVLKLATTLDGKIADRHGKSKWITGPIARQYVHNLRNRLDCVMVGAATARLDDPELNVREVENGRHPKRVVVDTYLSVEPNLRLCLDGTGGDTIIYARQDAIDERGARFPSWVSLVATPESPTHVLRDQVVSAPRRLDLRFIMSDLKARNVLSVLCEGGGTLAASLLNDELVDEIIWITAPAILGDPQAKSSIAANGPVPMESIQRFHHLETRQLGEDTLMHLTRDKFEFNLT